MNIEDIAMLTLFGAFTTLLGAERLFPHTNLPKVRLWTIRGFVVSAVAFVLSLQFPLLWDAWLSTHTLLDARGLGTIGGAVAGILFLELVNYAWHRALHRSDTLWRWFHQMHHSAERLDVASTFYFSPLDVLGWTAVASFALVFILGVSAPAAILANVILTVLNVLTHTNIATPRWLGWFVARPEMHRIHHERGEHRYNYATIPVWDLVFGTYRNPEPRTHETGFFDGASARIFEMLIGRTPTA